MRMWSTMRLTPMLASLVVACGANNQKPLTDADCENWVAKIRSCPLEGMSTDPKEREENLKWRLGSCKHAIAEKPTATDSLGAGMQRREARCGTASTCPEFFTCMDKAGDDAANEATDRVMNQ